MNSKQEIELIIKGCKKHKIKKQNLLYKKFYSFGMSISIRYFKTEDDAKFVLNQAFMNVFKNIQNFDEQMDFKPWFARIVVNASLNQLNKEKKYHNQATIDDVLDVPDANSNHISNMNYKELLTCIHQLSDKYRQVFNLYVIDGYKHHEIANMLSISEGTSKSNLLRAKSNLKKIIEGREFGA